MPLNVLVLNKQDLTPSLVLGRKLGQACHTAQCQLVEAGLHAVNEKATAVICFSMYKIQEFF